MESSIPNSSSRKTNFSSLDQSNRRCSGGRGKMENDRRRPHQGGEKDKIDALGRLLIRILRHMATELRLNIRVDGFVNVGDLLELNLKTSGNFQLKSHTIDEIRDAVRRDDKQRFSLLEEEDGELLIRANQGHSITTVESEQLLKPILSPEDAPVCVHGTYRKNLESILASGLKRMNRMHVHFSCGLPTDGAAISDGIALYMSNNKVILTEGIDGIVPVDYFHKIESWPDRQSIPF
ncbi:PREDICTED: tRNA 2'-phosphotransferase 1-like isoform X2 [Camelina sativa]|uniref:2'-phosphotransferase n=1 Tax=Camelina sativa TaxID=90675 RepID=A0ABM0XT66_CAMSA|nr:PREDICTED: tRNA 2'-phosphotransferase 1-like isoform X2 [Camelina sativa]